MNKLHPYKPTPNKDIGTSKVLGSYFIEDRLRRFLPKKAVTLRSLEKPHQVPPVVPDPACSRLCFILPGQCATLSRHPEKKKIEDTEPYCGTTLWNHTIPVLACGLLSKLCVSFHSSALCLTELLQTPCLNIFGSFESMPYFYSSSHYLEWTN